MPLASYQVTLPTVQPSVLVATATLLMSISTTGLGWAVASTFSITVSAEAVTGIKLSMPHPRQRESSTENTRLNVLVMVESSSVCLDNYIPQAISGQEKYRFPLFPVIRLHKCAFDIIIFC